MHEEKENEKIEKPGREGMRQTIELNKKRRFNLIAQAHM